VFISELIPERALAPYPYEERVVAEERPLVPIAVLVVVDLPDPLDERNLR